MGFIEASSVGFPHPLISFLGRWEITFTSMSYCPQMTPATLRAQVWVFLWGHLNHPCFPASPPHCLEACLQSGPYITWSCFGLIKGKWVVLQGLHSGLQKLANHQRPVTSRAGRREVSSWFNSFIFQVRNVRQDRIASSLKGHREAELGSSDASCRDVSIDSPKEPSFRTVDIYWVSLGSAS